MLRRLTLTWAAAAQALRMIQMNLTVTSVKVLTSSVVIVNIIRPKLFDTSKNFQTRSLSRLIMVNKNWYYLPQWVRLSLL